MLVSFWHGGTGLSFVALVSNNICAVASGFYIAGVNWLEFVVKGLQEVISANRKMRAGPFINGFNNQVYEGMC